MTETKAVTEAKKEQQVTTQEGNKEAVITNSTTIEETKNTDNNTLSKFNYLFYFIYKHKYQDINKLEEKL